MIPYAKDVEETAEMLVVEVFVYHMARTFQAPGGGAERAPETGGNESNFPGVNEMEI